MNDKEVEGHWKNFQNGNERALRFVVEHFQKRIFYFVLGKVGDEENAKELVSKLWIRLVNNKSKKINNLKSYIFKIAENLIKDEYKTRARARDFDDIDELSGKLSTSDVGQYDEEDFQERLKKVLTKVEIEICSFLLEGFNYIDIANKIGLQPSTVADRLTAIRKKLRKFL